ncbi:hypothetical protein P261_01662 [Lachnospiraceae bacterium TWA4]|nr:hypothetical protein P261_01662 [Lachnospiraceae bacterium TWA4]
MKVLLLSLITICLANSNLVTTGAYNGLTLWYRSIIPCLFPFMILTSLFANYLKGGGRFFAIGCGFLCGYPLGAKTASDLYKKGEIDAKELQLIANFCNLPSPMFLIGYAKLGKYVLIIYLTACIFLGIGYLRIERHSTHLTETKKISFEEISLNCCRVLLMIGIYVVLFSILYNLLKSMIPTTLLATLEITTGAKLVIKNPALTGFVCTFGGVCGMAQTLSVMKDCHFSLIKYAACKFLHAATIYLILKMLLP